MPRRLVLLVFILTGVAALTGHALAQDRPVDGAYEDFSALLMRPVGPLVTTPTLLPRWVEVHTEGDVTTVTFLPEARVTWRITWGPAGPTEKVTLIDGVEFTHSVFERDLAGHLVRKVVSGPGAGAGITYDYTTDSRGRVLTRTAALPSTPSAAFSGTGTQLELVRVTWGRRDTRVRTERDGTRVREDRLDAEGRTLSTTLYGRGGTATLGYRRARDGTLLSVTRQLSGRAVETADASVPDAAVRAEDVELVLSAPVERDEALLFLGAPVRSTDTGTGSARAIEDDWSSSCWLNATSGAHYDASGLALSTSSGCICGFCVDAELEASATSALLATDLHWTRGPWVRLDGEVDVTADHAVMTPEGPVLSGDLVAGDVVLAADGGLRTLASVEHLAETGPLRLGRNLRTESGTFAAGGFLFASEVPRPARRGDARDR